MTALILGVLVLWQLNRLSTDSGPLTLLRRLVMLWVAVCIWRVFGKIL